MNHKSLQRAAVIIGAIGTVVLLIIGTEFPDAKATVLGLWGVLCLLVMAAIILVEYISQNIVYGTEVAELPDDELKRRLAAEEVAIRTDARLDQLESGERNA